MDENTSFFITPGRDDNEILRKILKLERGTVFNINNLAVLTKQ